MSTAGTIFQALGRLPGSGGKLRLVSGTALSYLPRYGAGIRINGKLCAIPATGIAGLANTNVFVNGVAGQNLATTQTYRVYVFMNAGVPTADFSTTGHSTSTVDPGIEIKTGDPTRTLIGLITTNTDGTFLSGMSKRYVLSWYNRTNQPMMGSQSNGFQISANSGAVSMSNSGNYLLFDTWADEAMWGTVQGWQLNNIVDYVRSNMAWDGDQALLGLDNLEIINVAGAYWASICAWTPGIRPGGEGGGYFNSTGWVGGGGGLATYYLWLSAMLRG